MIRQKNNRPRLTPEDWQYGALEVIAEEGINALAIEPLARRMGVTKGSFYWHFRNRKALLSAALQLWEAQDESQVLSRLEPISDPRVRLRALFDVVAREIHSHRIYAALLKALDYPLVRDLMARVSTRRMEFLATTYSQAGMSTSEAQHRARLTYSAYLGFMQINMTLGLPRLSHDEFDAYVDHMANTLVP